MDSLPKTLHLQLLNSVTIRPRKVHLTRKCRYKGGPSISGCDDISICPLKKSLLHCKLIHPLNDRICRVLVNLIWTLCWAANLNGLCPIHTAWVVVSRVRRDLPCIKFDQSIGRPIVGRGEVCKQEMVLVDAENLWKMIAFEKVGRAQLHWCIVRQVFIHLNNRSNELRLLTKWWPKFWYPVTGLKQTWPLCCNCISWVVTLINISISKLGLNIFC